MPELKIDPKVGDVLFASPGRYREGYNAVVVRVARIKFDVIREGDYAKYQETGRGHVGTFRKDTAREDGDYNGNGPELYTPESWALKLRKDAAAEYLKSLGIEVYRLKGDVIDILTLANLVRNHLNIEEI